MPLFEMQCDKCGHIETVLVITSEDKKKYEDDLAGAKNKCLKCKKGKLQKVMALTAKGKVI